MFKFILSLALLATSAVHATSHELIKYCHKNQGTVEKMTAEFQSGGATVSGFDKSFCTFQIEGGFIAVGLKAFASERPNIAATLIKTLPEIKKDSPLWKGSYANPSINVCKNLGGSSISFNVISGGFTNKLGQSDICVFGDGSMVSAWSLIYIANGRNGYHVVREAIRSPALLLSY